LKYHKSSERRESVEQLSDRGPQVVQITPMIHEPAMKQKGAGEQSTIFPFSFPFYPNQFSYFVYIISRHLAFSPLIFQPASFPCLFPIGVSILKLEVDTIYNH